MILENEFFFPPFVGELYGKAEGFFNGVKVLAIGNSHHCDKDFYHENRCSIQCKNYVPSCKKFTSDVVEDYISNHKGIGLKEEDKKWRSTYTKFANLLYADGRPEKVWNSIVFYNFLQCAVPNKKAQGTPEEIARSKNQVIKLLTKYMPDVVIFWGEPNVYRNLPKGEIWQSISDRTGIYTVNGKNIRGICIDHPMICRYDKAREIIRSIAPELLNK